MTLTLGNLCTRDEIAPENILELWKSGLGDEVLRIDNELTERMRQSRMEAALVEGRGRLRGMARREWSRRSEPLVARLISLSKPGISHLHSPTVGSLPHHALEAIRLLTYSGGSLERAAMTLQPLRCDTLSCSGVCPGSAWHHEARHRLLDLIRIAHGAGRGEELFSTWTADEIATIALCTNSHEELFWLHKCNIRPHAVLNVVRSKLLDAEQRMHQSMHGFDDDADEIPDLFELTREAAGYLRIEVALLRDSELQLKTWKLHRSSCNLRTIIARSFPQLQCAQSLVCQFLCGKCACFICDLDCTRKAAMSYEHVFETKMSQVNSSADASSEFAVIELIRHPDPPAIIDPDVAQSSVTADWVDNVEARLPDVSTPAAAYSPAVGLHRDTDDLVQLRFKRHPPRLRSTFLKNTALTGCIQALRDRGYTCELPSKSLLFVHPCQYREAVRIITDMRLTQSDILCAGSILDLVEEALSAIPSRHRPSRTITTVGDMGPHRLVAICRTFIGFIPRRLAASEVTQSTTEAHGSLNPRRQTHLELD